MPATVWVGAVLLVVLCLVQVGKAAISGGSGLLQLFKGIAQYMIVSVSALGILMVLVTAANAAALGILADGLHADSWHGISAANTPWQNGVNGVFGAGLGLIALLGVLPAAIGLLVAALVREASILVIAATIPILAAGLVAEATARWFWTGLRWLLALIMLTPAVAIVLALGLQLAAGAANATSSSTATAGDTGQQAVTAFVGAGVLLISVFCPLALFKLFAFIDPGTGSGQRLRTSLSPGGSTAASSGQNVQTSQGGSSTSGATTTQENDASEQVDSRWAAAVGKLSAPHRAMASGAQSAMSSAGPVLSAVGVGAGADPDHGTRRPPSRNTSTPRGPDRGSDPSTSSTSSTEQTPPPPPPQVDPPAPPEMPSPDPSGPGHGAPGPKPDQPAGGSRPGSKAGPKGGAAGAGAAEAAVVA